MAVFLAAWVFLAGTASAQGELGPERYSGVDQETVADALAGLTGGGEYEYDRSMFEEPAWVLWLRDWVRRLDERWSSGPLVTLWGSYSIVGAVLAALLITGAIALLLARLMAGGWSGGGMIGEGEQVGESAANGAWGEEGIRHAVELASAGKLRQAASALFRSILRGLDRSGWIHYRRGRSSRSYLRQLRRSEEMYPLYRDFLRRFEVAYYRQREPSEDDWRFLFGTYENLARVASTVRPPAYMRRT